jgi:hypothetical protein
MKYRELFIARLGTAEWMASSVAIQFRCRPLYGEQSGEKNTLCTLCEYSLWSGRPRYGSRGNTKSVLGVQVEISLCFTWLSFRFLRGLAIKCFNDSDMRRYSWSLPIGNQEGDHPLNNNCREYTKTPRHGDTWGSGGLVPSILNLGSSWVWVVS